MMRPLHTTMLSLTRCLLDYDLWNRISEQKLLDGTSIHLVILLYKHLSLLWSVCNGGNLLHESLSLSLRWGLMVFFGRIDYDDKLLRLNQSRMEMV